ncbi:MAG: hypothetical protein QFX34_01755 [Candidatus Verstraetearchaeota archaeon]|nr:hypothetical protein [Candidatus Verstraetearchaeota archaeon]
MSTTSKRKKGVSTVVGMTIFVLIFALVASYAFVWTSELNRYIENVRVDMREQHLRSQEVLIVTPINDTAISVYNPTSEVVVVTQVWSGHDLKWTGQRGVPPFSSVTFPSFGQSQTDGNFRVVTLRGNIFSGSYQDLMERIQKRTWIVNWYWNTTSQENEVVPPLQLSKSTPIGTSYFYDLRIDWEWTDDAAVVANYYYNSTNTIGFVAKALLVKTTDESQNATIRFMMDPRSLINFQINGSWPDWPPGMDYDDLWMDSTVDAYIVIQGPKYSVHEVTVFFKTVGYDGPVYLRLNIANAAFYP